MATACESGFISETCSSARMVQHDRKAFSTTKPESIGAAAANTGEFLCCEPYFWGNITRDQANAILKVERPMTFLMRSGSQGGFVLSVQMQHGEALHWQLQIANEGFPVTFTFITDEKTFVMTVPRVIDLIGALQGSPEGNVNKSPLQINSWPVDPLRDPHDPDEAYFAPYLNAQTSSQVLSGSATGSFVARPASTPGAYAISFAQSYGMQHLRVTLDGRFLVVHTADGTLKQYRTWPELIAGLRQQTVIRDAIYDAAWCRRRASFTTMADFSDDEWSTNSSRAELLSLSNTSLTRTPLYTAAPAEVEFIHDRAGKAFKTDVPSMSVGSSRNSGTLYSAAPEAEFKHESSRCLSAIPNFILPHLANTIAFLACEPYFWGALSSNDAERLLETQPRGTFIIRTSSQGGLAMSRVGMTGGGQVRHILITPASDGWLQIPVRAGEKKFAFVHSLITEYQHEELITSWPVDVLRNFMSPEGEAYYLGSMSAADAATRLFGMSPGTFLVRWCTEQQVYTLSYIDESKQIQHKTGFTIDDSRRGRSWYQVIAQARNEKTIGEICMSLNWKRAAPPAAVPSDEPIYSSWGDFAEKESQ